MILYEDWEVQQNILVFLINSSTSTRNEDVRTCCLKKPNGETFLF